MNYLLRRPGIYLCAHWALALGLAGALLLPHATTSRAGDTVTILTGQVVHVGNGYLPIPAADLTEGHLFGPDNYAVPSNTLPAVGTFFDPRLFDVTYLASQGYDDRDSTRIPVIVQFASHEMAVRAVQYGSIEGGIRLTHAFEYAPYAEGFVSKHGPFVPATAGSYGQVVTVPAAGSENFQLSDSSGVVSIFLNGVVHEAPDTISPALDSALPLLNIDAARKLGLTGKGVRIAVVDTGIDATHPDLAGRIVAAKNFSTDKDVLDHFGHGTHVAGIAAGTGAASDGKYGGVAPQVLLINAKALSSAGGGTEAGIMRAMEWAADSGARVVNMSLGGGQTDGTDPLSREVNAITEQKNVLFVIAAGNSAPRQKVSTPAAADRSLAVGAIDKSKNMAAFSSRGPRIKDMALKPDVVAPGVSITAPRANYGTGNPYATYSGTSMATPMVAGSAALVIQLHPTWTAQQVKDALMSSTAPIGAVCESVGCDGYVGAYDQGAGLTDLAGIASQAAVAEPASLSFGLVSRDDQSEKTLTLRNLTAQTLLVRIQGTLHGPQGNTVDGLEVSASQLSLPPEGTAELRLRLRAPAAAGNYSGDLTLYDNASGQRVTRAVLAFVVK